MHAQDPPPIARTPDHAASRTRAFHDLAAEAAACRLCPRMEGRRRVLSLANGPLDAAFLFVAEAPGRLGGDRTGTPLRDDQSGRNFSALLAGAGIPRERIFVTNAVLCNPRDEQGRNAKPSAAELARCRPFLRRTLTLVRAPIVVALGRVALESLRAVEPHDLELRRDVSRAVPWAGRLLVPLYHPGPRAQIHRSFALQQGDFMALAEVGAVRTGLGLARAMMHVEDLDVGGMEAIDEDVASLGDDQLASAERAAGPGADSADVGIALEKILGFLDAEGEVGGGGGAVGIDVGQDMPDLGAGRLRID